MNLDEAGLIFAWIRLELGRGHAEQCAVVRAAGAARNRFQASRAALTSCRVGDHLTLQEPFAFLRIDRRIEIQRGRLPFADDVAERFFALEVEDPSRRGSASSLRYPRPAKRNRRSLCPVRSAPSRSRFGVVDAGHIGGRLVGRVIGGRMRFQDRPVAPPRITPLKPGTPIELHLPVERGPSSRCWSA